MVLPTNMVTQDTNVAFHQEAIEGKPYPAGQQPVGPLEWVVVDMNAVHNLENPGADVVGGRDETLRKVQAAAVGPGTAILSHNHLDVRLRKLGGAGES